MGKLIVDGAVPYRDFFFASPPLIPYAMALLGWLAGFRWQAAAFGPICFSVLDAVIIYLLARHRWSRLAGLLAAVMYLGSFVVLATSDFYSGVHLSLTLMLLGVLAQQRGRPVLSGALFALAVLGKLYMAVLVVAVWLAELGQRRWRGVASSAAVFVLVVSVVTAVFSWLAGAVFFDMT